MPVKTIQVTERILATNASVALGNREAFDAAGVFAINLISSPGAGKTSLVEATVAALLPNIRVGMINGDTAPAALDAERGARAGACAIHINTAGKCHLEANMIRLAMESLPLQELDLVIVENVGNLVCPSSWALGTHATVLIASTPEGSDKPFKYPASYRGVDALVLNKTDLLPYLDFDMKTFLRGVSELNRDVKIFPMSCRTRDGFPAWLEWLTARIAHSAHTDSPLADVMGRVEDRKETREHFNGPNS